jgi:hypothetical protein
MMFGYGKYMGSPTHWIRAEISGKSMKVKAVVSILLIVFVVLLVMSLGKGAWPTGRPS